MSNKNAQVRLFAIFGSLFICVFLILRGIYSHMTAPSASETAKDAVPLAIKYDRITSGMTPVEVMQIAGTTENTIPVAGREKYAVFHYAQDGDTLDVELDRDNDNNEWLVDDVWLHERVDSSNPNGLETRIKYGPIPQSCLNCSR